MINNQKFGKLKKTLTIVSMLGIMLFANLMVLSGCNGYRQDKLYEALEESLSVWSAEKTCFQVESYSYFYNDNGSVEETTKEILTHVHDNKLYVECEFFNVSHVYFECLTDKTIPYDYAYYPKEQNKYLIEQYEKKYNAKKQYTYFCGKELLPIFMENPDWFKYDRKNKSYRLKEGHEKEIYAVMYEDMEIEDDKSLSYEITLSIVQNKLSEFNMYLSRRKIKYETKISYEEIKVELPEYEDETIME